MGTQSRLLTFSFQFFLNGRGRGGHGEHRRCGFGGEGTGDLQSVHEDTGLAFVQPGFAESGEDNLDGALDACSGFNGREFQARVGVLGGVHALVELLVVVAVGHAAERNGMAAPAVGHRVVTSSVHIDIS
jgi:hypothetical protein